MTSGRGDWLADFARLPGMASDVTPAKGRGVKSFGGEGHVIQPDMVGRARLIQVHLERGVDLF